MFGFILTDFDHNFEKFVEVVFILCQCSVHSCHARFLDVKTQEAAVLCAACFHIVTSS